MTTEVLYKSLYVPGEGYESIIIEGRNKFSVDKERT